MIIKTRASYFLATLAAAVMVVGQVSNAATTSDTFVSTITINASCDVISTETLDFGSNGVLTTNVDVSADIVVQCSDATTYDIGLDAGTGGGNTTTRLMTDGSDTVSYQMFSDAGRQPADNWGEVVGADTVAGTGDGDEQTWTVYGRVPIQVTPAPSTYSDTVTVTITY